VGILKDKTCPKCGAGDALQICPHTFAVNCFECLEVIRILSKEERVELLKEIEKITKSITFIDK